MSETVECLCTQSQCPSPPYNGQLGQPFLLLDSSTVTDFRSTTSILLIPCLKVLVISK